MVQSIFEMWQFFGGQTFVIALHLSLICIYIRTPYIYIEFNGCVIFDCTAPGLDVENQKKKKHIVQYKRGAGDGGWCVAWAKRLVVEGHLGVVFLAWTRLLAFVPSLGIYNINMDDWNGRKAKTIKKTSSLSCHCHYLYLYLTARALHPSLSNGGVCNPRVCVCVCVYVVPLFLIMLRKHKNWVPIRNNKRWPAQQQQQQQHEEEGSGWVFRGGW